MRKITLTMTIFLLTTIGALTYEQGKTDSAPLIPGTDTASTKKCAEGTAYIYDTYTIYAVKSPDFEGQNIYVFKTKKGEDPCGMDVKNMYYTINAGEFGGANTFAGLLGEKLFIDQWPGRDHKRVLVIDIPKKSLSFFDWYDDPVIENGVLHYNRVLKASKGTKKSIPCPNAEKWESEGLLPIYIQKARVNLTTMKKSISDTRSCKPVSPIQNAKTGSYRGH